MLSQLLHHPEADQRFLDGVMKDVEADETSQEFQLVRLFLR